MGFFNRNFDRPGPGVSKDAPRKKGLPRFFELLGRDIGSFFKANLLCAAAALPGALMVSFGLSCLNVLITLLGGVVGGMLLAPFYAGMHDTVLRALRDEPGYWWHVYKKALKNNAKQSLAPGALVGLLVSGQILALWMVLKSGMVLTLPVCILLGINLLLTGMVTPFLWSQLVLMDMSFGLLLKNSLLFAFASAPRALLLALLQVAYWAAMLLLMPFTVFWVALFGFAFIVLILMMITFPVLDKTFHLEEQLIARRQEQLDEALARDEAGTN